MKAAQIRTGLYFGSFNPVHIGHLAIANYFLRYSDLDEIWFILSPQNPHKHKKGLTDPWLRLEMLHLATDHYKGFQVSDIELYLPQPSYTTVTLAHLQEKHPGYGFSLIMGTDNLSTLTKWFNYKAIVDQYPIYVYPRPGFEAKVPEGANVTLVNAPLMEISSSFIRQAIRDRIDIRFFLPAKVYDYIEKEQLYR
jgi:nicotinate-nucleotide adenylyltransferase